MTYDWISVNGETFALVRPDDLPARRPSEAGEALKPRTAAEVEKYAAIEDVNRRANEGLKRLTQPRTCAEARERGWIRHEEVVARANLAEALQSYVTNKRGLLALMDQIDAYLDERIRRASATGGEGGK